MQQITDIQLTKKELKAEIMAKIWPVVSTLKPTKKL
jgi:hypothetical protein